MQVHTHTHSWILSFYCRSFLSPFLFPQPRPLLTLSHSPEAPGSSGHPLWIQTLPGWNFRQLFPKPWFHLVTISLRSSEWHEYYSSLIRYVHQLVFKAPSRGTGLHIQCELPPCSPYTHLFVPAPVCILSLLQFTSHFLPKSFYEDSRLIAPVFSFLLYSKPVLSHCPDPTALSHIPPSEVHREHSTHTWFSGTNKWDRTSF